MTTYRIRAIVGSVLVALVLSAVPLPDSVETLRPLFVPIVVAHWCIWQPNRVGIMVAFVLGLCLDTLYASLLGQHAVAMGVMAYLVLKFGAMLRVFPFWQQAVALLPALAAYQGLVIWIGEVSQHAGLDWNQWLTVLTSALIWPAATILLSSLPSQDRQH